ncbi:hypothetical protein ACX8Z9_15415 [Arthrobacter halodurans]
MEAADSEASAGPALSKLLENKLRKSFFALKCGEVPDLVGETVGGLEVHEHERLPAVCAAS